MGSNDKRMTRVEAASYLGVSKSWLNDRAAKGEGPPFVRMGSVVYYLQSDLDDFLSAHKTTRSESAPKKVGMRKLGKALQQRVEETSTLLTVIKHRDGRIEYRLPNGDQHNG